jgi:hypothetical protein
MYVIVKKLRWYHRFLHHILTLLGKECYAYETLAHVDLPYVLRLGSVWLCPGCWRYRSWDLGCAHEDPEESRLCDDCWCKRKEEERRCDPLSQ